MFLECGWMLDVLGATKFILVCFLGNIFRLRVRGVPCAARFLPPFSCVLFLSSVFVRYYQIMSGNRGIIIKVFIMLILFIWLFLGVMR